MLTWTAWMIALEQLSRLAIIRIVIPVERMKGPCRRYTVFARRKSCDYHVK